MKTFEFIVENATLIEPYFNIFNTIAAFFSDATYLEILKIAFLLGGFYAFLIAIASIFRMSLSFQNTQIAPFKKFTLLISYILGVFFLLTMSYYKGKVDVIIKTNKVDTYCSLYTKQDYHTVVTGKYKLAGGASNAVVVGNIPYLWAWVFTSINEVGRTLTNFANASFRDATDTQINRGNYVDYLHAASGILSMKLSDLTPATLSHTGKYDTITILEAVKKDCISIPSSKAPFLSEDILDGVNKSGDIIRTLDGYFTKNELRLFKNPTDPTGNLIGSNIIIDGTAPGNYLVTVGDDTYRCKALWDNFKKDIEAINKEQGGICHGALYSYLTPENVSIFTGDRKTKVSAPQTNNIILQAAMINQFMEQKSKLPSEITFASGKSMAQITLNSAGTGFYMAKMLPYIQMSLRAVLYAFFPFIFIVMIFPYGLRVLGQYLRTLIWIELWMPIAAVLNMFIMFGISEKFKLLYDGAGMNIANSIQVFSESFIMAGVAGYLFAFVPAIAWMILKGSDQMLGRITANGLAQVAANFESKTINEDVRNLSRTQEYNNVRKQKGQELVSMAEQDMQRAEIKGKQEAGEYVANIENSDRLSLAAYGKKEEDLLKSIAKGNFLLSEDGGKNSITAKESMSLESNQEYLKSLGVLNENGTINKDKLNAFAKSIGIEKSISDLTAQEFQNQAEVARRVQAGIVQKQKELGQNEGVTGALKEGLKVLAAEGNTEASKLLKRLNAGDDTAISESFALMAPYGEFGSMYNKKVADATASMLFSANFGSELKGSMKTSDSLADVYKNYIMEDTYGQTVGEKDNSKFDGSYDKNDNAVNLGAVEVSLDLPEMIVNDIYEGVGINGESYIRKSLKGAIRGETIAAYNQTINSLSTYENYQKLLNDKLDDKKDKDKDKILDQNFKRFFTGSQLINFASKSGNFIYHSHSPIDELDGSARNAMVSMKLTENMKDIMLIDSITSIPFVLAKKTAEKAISKEAGDIIGTIKRYKSSLVSGSLATGFLNSAINERAEILKEIRMKHYKDEGQSGGNFVLNKNYSDNDFMSSMSDKNKTWEEKADLLNYYVYAKMQNHDVKQLSNNEIESNIAKLSNTLDNGILQGSFLNPYSAEPTISDAIMIRGDKDVGKFVLTRINELVNFIEIGSVTANTEQSYKRIQDFMLQLRNDSNAMNELAKSPYAVVVQSFAETMQNKDSAMLMLNEIRKNSFGLDGADKTEFKKSIEYRGFLNNDKLPVEMLTLAFMGYVDNLDHINTLFKNKSNDYSSAIETARHSGNVVNMNIDSSKGYIELNAITTTFNNIETSKNVDIAFSSNSSKEEVVGAVLDEFTHATSSKQIENIKNMPVIVVQEISETIARMLYENKISDPIQRSNAEKVLNILADTHSGRGTVLDQKNIIGEDKWIETIGYKASLSYQKNLQYSRMKSENVDFDLNTGFGSGMIITKAISRIINDNNYAPTQYTTDFNEKNAMFTRGFFENKSHSISAGFNKIVDNSKEKETLRESD